MNHRSPVATFGIGGGRKMHLECRGTGSPTVVLVAGLRGSAEDWKIAEKQAPTVFRRGRQVHSGLCLRPSRNAGWGEAEPQ
jgi:hypothetical protein